MTPDDEVCDQCQVEAAINAETPLPQLPEERLRGWCCRCGYFFDHHGMRLLEPWRTCKVHDPINASCPHSGSLRYPDAAR